MFLKITVIVIVAFIATSDGGEVWDGFSAKWARNVNDGFYELPTTLKAARKEGWTVISGVDPPRGLSPLRYQGYPRFVLFFSNLIGKVAGHQLGLPIADLVDFPIDYSANPAMTKKKLNGEDYFTATAAYRDDAGGKKIWLERDGKLERIPTTSDLLISETPFYPKTCVDQMGQHFYQINSTTSPANLFPWFLLVVGKDVIGIGFELVGHVVSSAPNRTWFETIPNSHTAATNSDAPDATTGAILSHELVSLHVWFKKNPVAIRCIDECTAVYNGTEESEGDRSMRKRRSTGSGNVCERA